MTMTKTDRVIRDIRYYEIKPENYGGKFDGIIGNIYSNSRDTKYIGQRIARKLNEFEFVSGIFDHVYICLSPNLSEYEFRISDSEMDDRLKSVHCGMDPTVFNCLNESDKDKLITEITFKVLHLLFDAVTEKIEIISKVEYLLNKFGQEIEIFYKAKETKHHKIELSFQIRPNAETSKIILRLFDKIANTRKETYLDLFYYEDIYYLVDTISIKDDYIVLNPKKSYRATLATEKYTTPLMIDISKLGEKIAFKRYGFPF
jgi:hypothetical protein